MRRYAGLGKSNDFPAHLIKEACLEAQLLAKAQGNYEIYTYDSNQAIIRSAQPLTLKGEVIKKHLADATQIAVMAVTIGNQLEQAITSRFAQGLYSTAVLIDAAATAAVEIVANQVNTIIDHHAAKLGYLTTRRFSPGYGNWPITAQAAVTTLAGGHLIGISVTETSMLQPRKSVTAVIGLVANQDQCLTNQNAVDCIACGQKNCPSRKP